MKRKSRLAVLVRLSRLEESRRLLAFAQQRRSLEALDSEVVDTENQVADSGRSRWLHTHGTSESADLRRADTHRAHLLERLQQLGRERKRALDRVGATRRELARARLRTRALEKVEARRLAELRAEQQKREEARVEEAHRGISEGVKRAPR